MASSLKNSRSSIAVPAGLRRTRVARRLCHTVAAKRNAAPGTRVKSLMLHAFCRLLNFRRMTRFPFPVAHEVPLYLAPMAGVSESPFRRLCRRFGADVVVTEFLSAEGIRRENEATLDKLRFGPDERPIGVQIFGGDPVAMGEAARARHRCVSAGVHRHQLRLSGQKGRATQRRLGLPASDLDLVQEVIRAVARATPCRSRARSAAAGTKRCAIRSRSRLRCQDAGVRAIALHPRTRTQMYSGARAGRRSRRSWRRSTSR